MTAQAIVFSRRRAQGLSLSISHLVSIPRSVYYPPENTPLSAIKRLDLLLNLNLI
jgi:hypothetical protein